MNSREKSNWEQFRLQRQNAAKIAVSAMIALSVAFPLLPVNPAEAQQSENRITDISISPKGELLIEVEGEGFDPMLRLEPMPNGEYRIVVQGQGVTLNPDVSQSAAHLGADLRGRIPAIDKAAFSTIKTQSGGFQLVLTAWRKLQPQVLINNGNQIVISLIGERSVPQAVLQQRQHAEQQRIAALKKQEQLKKQAELQKQIAMQHEAELKRKAKAAQQAQFQREADQQKLAEERRQAIAERPRDTQYDNQNNAPQEPDDDFAALKRQEAQRLAAHQRQAMAQHQDGYNNFLPDELSASPEPAEPVTPPQPQPQTVAHKPGAGANSAPMQNRKATTTASNLHKAIAAKPTVKPNGAASKTAVHPGTTVAANMTFNPNSTANAEQTAEWTSAYSAQKPLTAGEFMTELQLAQPTGDPNKTHKKTQKSVQENAPAGPKANSGAQTNGAQANPEAPVTQSSQETPAGKIVPVNFSGSAAQSHSQTHSEPQNDSAEDNAPTEPLRLKKLPPNFAPEPDASEASPELPANVPGSTSTPKIKSPAKPDPCAGAVARPMNSIYAVINQPNANPLLRQAWQALTAGLPKQAQFLLRQHLQSAPNDANARYLLAEILLSPLSENPGATPAQAAANLAERRKEAQRQLLTNYAHSLHWPSCQALLELFIDDNKLSEANGLMKQVLQAFPNEAGAHYEHGRLLEAQDNLDAARAAYQAALSLQPENPEIHYRLAQVELKADHLEAARWELLQALSWSPNDSRLYKLLGYIADRSGQKQQAAQAYRQALPLDALINYARALEAQNQPERALSLYQAVETLAGDNSDILYNLAMIYHDTHRTTHAATALKRFISLNGSRTGDQRVAKAKSLLQQLKP